MTARAPQLDATEVRPVAATGLLSFALGAIAALVRDGSPQLPPERQFLLEHLDEGRLQARTAQPGDHGCRGLCGQVGALRDGPRVVKGPRDFIATGGDRNDRVLSPCHVQHGRREL